MLFLFLKFTLKLAIFADQFLILALKFSLVIHARSAGAIGILSYLAPTGKLFWVKPSLPAEGSQVGATEGSGLDHGRQLVGSAPLLRCLAARRHQLAFQFPAMALAIEGWGRNARAAGDLSHALPVWPPADFVYGGSFARGFGPAQRGHKSFSWSSVRPLVDGSNRVDNFADAGGGVGYLHPF